MDVRHEIAAFDYLAIPGLCLASSSLGSFRIKVPISRANGNNQYGICTMDNFLQILPFSLPMRTQPSSTICSLIIGESPDFLRQKPYRLINQIMLRNVSSMEWDHRKWTRSHYRILPKNCLPPKNSPPPFFFTLAAQNKHV